MCLQRKVQALDESSLPLCPRAAVRGASPLPSVTVSSPANGATVTSPLAFAAIASPCSSQSVASMGYLARQQLQHHRGLGNSDAGEPILAAGAHVLHVKSWGNKGASCTANVTITVIQGTSTATTTNVVVSSPVSGASVTSPLSLAASGTLYLGQTITAIGYSLDASASTTIVSGTA